MSDLDKLLKLYRPNTQEGNYQADVAWRGGNRTLRQAITALGLATDEEVAAHFKALDDESWKRSEARIAAAAAEPKANPDVLRAVTITLCDRCIDGAGGECHTPGCALWMNRAPDIPILQAAKAASPQPSPRDAIIATGLAAVDWRAIERGEVDPREAAMCSIRAAFTEAVAEDKRDEFDGAGCCPEEDGYLRMRARAQSVAMPDTDPSRTGDATSVSDQFSAEPSPNPLRVERAGDAVKNCLADAVERGIIHPGPGVTVEALVALAYVSAAEAIKAAPAMEPKPPVSTEPSLRDALERLLGMVGDLPRARLTQYEEVGLDAAVAYARGALATDQSQSDRTSDEATPAEPTYEWRACFKTHFGEVGYTVGAGGSYLTEAQARRVVAGSGWLQRRTAPGPWERVDDEGSRE